VPEAISRASLWWESKGIKQVFPNGETARLFADWMVRFQLGRKRILDTLLAATYLSNGIQSVITSNARDFEIYNTLEVTVP
jgi:predicted nucleic acid-binding protein